MPRKLQFSRRKNCERKKRALRVAALKAEELMKKLTFVTGNPKKLEEVLSTINLIAF